MRQRREKIGPRWSVPAGPKGSCGIQHRVKDKKKIGVVAYSGYKGEEAPRSFLLEEVKVNIVSVIRAWVEESLDDKRRKRFFKVKGSDGFIYTLYYDEAHAEWFLAGK